MMLNLIPTPMISIFPKILCKKPQKTTVQNRVVFPDKEVTVHISKPLLFIAQIMRPGTSKPFKNGELVC